MQKNPYQILFSNILEVILAENRETHRAVMERITVMGGERFVGKITINKTEREV